MSLRNDSPISAWRRRLNAAALTALLCCAPFAAAQEEAPAPEFVEIPAEVLPEPEPQPAVEPERPQVRVEARILEWQMTNGLDFDSRSTTAANAFGLDLETID